MILVWPDPQRPLQRLNDCVVNAATPEAPAIPPSSFVAITKITFPEIPRSLLWRYPVKPSCVDLVLLKGPQIRLTILVAIVLYIKNMTPPSKLTTNNEVVSGVLGEALGSNRSSRVPTTRP